MRDLELVLEGQTYTEEWQEQRTYDHVWFWRKFLPDRKGQRCRRICQGRNGNVLIEFDDGYRTVAPRYAIRRAA